MQSATVNGVKVYNLSAGKTLPEFLTEKKKEALRKDEDFKRRIELIQGFEFPIASQRVRVSPDGNYVAATGTYPPAIKLYELSQLGVKCERRLENEVTQFQFLSDDYTKLALMHADRTVEFHAQFGSYYRTRLPRVGRDMVYHPPSCDLYMCGSSSEIWRLNLEQGRFLAPVESSASSLNCCAMCPAHMLLGFGGEGGILECLDPRAKASKPAASLDIGEHIRALLDEQTGERIDIHSLAFGEDGLTIAVGASTGHCMLYDLRSSRPLMHKYHQNGMPIVSVKFHQGNTSATSSCHVLSADSKVVKIWDKKNGDLLCAVEGSADITEICTVGSTGMFFLSGEQKRIQTLFVPTLGPAPKWCSFLESLTEELEEAAPSVYADYKFVTKQELADLGLEKMIGSDYLRAYMHGYFVDMRIYNKMRAVVDPFAYERYRKELIQSKIDAKTKTRISASKAGAPKVNASLAADMDKAAESATAGKLSKKQKQKAEAAKALRADTRFGKMFTSEDFEFDHSVAVEEKGDLGVAGGLEEEDGPEDTLLGEHFERAQESEEDDFEEEPVPKKAAGKKRKAEMFELKTGHSLASAMPELVGGLEKGEKTVMAKKIKEVAPLSKRVSVLEKKAAKKTPGAEESAVSSSGQVTGAGEREMTFTVAAKSGRSRGDNFLNSGNSSGVPQSKRRRRM